MDALEFIGHGIFLTIGFALGVAVMYFFEVFMDWKEDRQHYDK